MAAFGRGLGGLIMNNKIILRIVIVQRFFLDSEVIS